MTWGDRACYITFLSRLCFQELESGEILSIFTSEGETIRELIKTSTKGCHDITAGCNDVVEHHYDVIRDRNDLATSENGVGDITRLHFAATTFGDWSGGKVLKR